MCPLFRSSTVLQGTVDLIPMCSLFRGSTVPQGRVDLSFIQRFHCTTRESRPVRGSTVLQWTVDLITRLLFRGFTTPYSKTIMQMTGFIT